MTERHWTIGDGMQVTLHFSLTLPEGEVIDSTFDGDPATFRVGGVLVGVRDISTPTENELG